MIDIIAFLDLFGFVLKAERFRKNILRLRQKEIELLLPDPLLEETVQVLVEI